MNFTMRLSAVAALAMVMSVTGSAVAAPLATSCNAAYVSQSHTKFTVKPTGSDDTANLQCAFNAAVATGHGAEVRLGPGLFHTAQVVINNFQGRWTGAGMERTTVTNLPNLTVTEVDFYLNPPSAANPAPFLFAFINGDVSISDLGVKIAGAEPTTGWTIFGLAPIKSMAAAMVFEGSHIDVRVDHILVIGEANSDPNYGYNLYNGIFFEGFIGAVPDPPVSGSYSVTNSKFRTLASSNPWGNVANAKAVISHNQYEGVMFAMDGGDFVNSSYEFSHNKVDAMVGLDFYDMYGIMQSTSLLIKDNEFRGQTAIDIEMTFGDGNHCLIQGNNVQKVTGTAIILGPNAKGCVVKGAGKTSVLDLGAGNLITGADKKDKGEQQKVTTLFKFKK